MKVRRVIEKDVNCCVECPFFDGHPHDASCRHPYFENQKDAYAGYLGWQIARHGIPKYCPVKRFGNEWRNE